MPTSLKDPNLQNFVPQKVSPKTIGIIGGKGAMGHWLAEQFHADEEDYTVRVSGEDADIGMEGRTLTRVNEGIMRDSDVIVFSVPIQTLQEGVQHIVGTGNLRGMRGKLLMDLSSTKTAPLQTLSEVPGTSVIGLHPMFGPSVKDLKGQNIFMCPVYPDGDKYPVLYQRLEKWIEWVEAFWKKRKANLQLITPEKHDKIVTYVQFAVLESVMLYASVLKELGADLSMIRNIATPNSHMMTGLVGRMLRQHTTGVYANLAAENPNNKAIAESFAKAAQDVLQRIEQGGTAIIQELLRELAGFQDPQFNKEGFEDTVLIQQALAQRSFVERALKNRERIETMLGEE